MLVAVAAVAVGEGGVSVVTGIARGAIFGTQLAQFRHKRV